MDAWRYVQLKEVNGRVKFISFEPLLTSFFPFALWCSMFPKIEVDWFIIGAQTGKDAQKPDRKDVEELIKRTDKEKIPVFLKNNLKGIMPELRQEFPKIC